LKFAPSQSIISQTFSGEATALWSLFPETAAHWSPDFLVLEGHEIPVSAIAFSPDGQLIASAGYGGNVRLWSLAGEQLHALEQQQRGEIRYITFCEEGKQIASLDANGDVWFWDVDTWEQVQEYHLHKLGSIDDLGLYDQRAMSSTGHIASIDWRTLWLLDPRREHNQQLSASTMTFIDHPIDDLVDRPDEDVEDMSRGRTDDMIENVSQCGSQWEIVLTAIAFSPDGQLAAGTENGWFMFWASGTNFQPWMNKLHSGRIAHIAFASDGKFATEDNDGYVCVWSYSSGEVSSLWRRKFELDREPMTLGPGGLFVIGSGRTMEVWDIYADVQVGEMSGHRNSVTALAFSLKGQLASASWDKTIRLWTTSSMNGRTAERKTEVETGYSEVYAFALSSDEAILISGHENGDVRTWDTQTGKESQCFNEACAGVVTAMAFSPDGRAVASTSGDGTVRMWDTDTGKVLRYFQGQSTHVLSVLFSPDGRLIASGSMEGLLLLWDPNTGKALRRCESEGGVWSLAFSPDGEVVVSVHSHHMARFWNAQTGQLLHQWGFEGHNVSQLAVSCNKVIATAASQQWPVQLWDGDTGQLLLELYADDNALMPGRLRFSLDGNILQTNAGTFHLTDALLSVGTTPSLKPAPLGLNKAGDWIQQYGEDTLWIPSEFRSSGILCLCLSHKHFLAIPTATRGMVFFHPKI
jgi:WD40 repeat protein